MDTLSLSLLGGFHAELNSEPITAFESNKVRALLVYLAVEANRPHQRSFLAGLLWPDHPEEAARTNLRHVLRQLRQTLGEQAASSPLLLTSKQTVQFNPNSSSTLDVARFEHLLVACVRCAHDKLEACPICMDRYSKAAALYRGPFLAGLNLQDSDLFNEWATLQREQLHRQALEVFFTLASFHEQNGDPEQARQYAWRQLELEPWREEAHRQVMRVLARSGQRAAALAQYEQCRSILADELGIEPDTETVMLYQAIRAGTHESSGEQTHAPSPRSRRTAIALPTLSAPLIGRADEVAAVCQMLQQSDVRLLTLAGPGGIGKTRLALQVANTLLHDDAAVFADGVSFVDLSAIHAADRVVNTIARALNVQETPEMPLLARLKEQLRDRQLLLVLDNFEQVVSAATQIGELLATCPRVKALITSRTALRLRAEQIYAVPVLALPPLVPLPDLTALAAYPAVALFVQRAQAVLPGFRLNAANAHVVAEICARLDGLPLAIELAAARVRLLAPHDLLAHLRDSMSSTTLQLLTQNVQDAPARQQTLYDTIDWSYQLLDPLLQTLFARLAVFVGGCTLESAARVMHVAFKKHQIDILDGLTALIDHNLLQQELREDGAGRLRMLETIREYALGQLAARGEAEALRRAHAAYFLALAEEAEPQLQGVDQADWLDRLEIEHENLRAALRWALERGEIETGLRITAALGEFWWPRGHLSEGRRWLDAMLSMRSRVWGAATPSDQSAANHLTPHIAKALCSAGKLSYGQGEYSVALPLLEQSLMLYRQLEDKSGIACALRYIGNVHASLNDEQPATTTRAESLALFRELGDGDGIAWLLVEIGSDEHDSARRVTLIKQSLAVARAGGYQRTVVTALSRLGQLAHQRGDYAQARQFLQESCAIGRKLRDTWLVVITTIMLGELALDQGDDAQAATLFEESLVLSQNGGHDVGIVISLSYLGDLAQRQEDFATAIERYEESLIFYRRFAVESKCDEMLYKIEQMYARLQATALLR